MFGQFGYFPSKKLRVEYAKKLEEAMQIYRLGDFKKFTAKIREAERIASKIAKLKPRFQ